MSKFPLPLYPIPFKNFDAGGVIKHIFIAKLTELLHTRDCKKFDKLKITKAPETVLYVQ